MCIRDRHAGGPSVEEKMMQASGHDIILHRANIDRVAGAAQIRDYLSLNDEGKPRLYFFDTCPLTIDCISRMVHDPKRPEDVLKVDAVDSDPTTGDDLYDCLRYALMARPRIAMNEENPKDRYYREKKENKSWLTI